MKDKLTHIDDTGKASMVDVSAKSIVHRTATACGKIYLSHATIDLIKENSIAKGDVLACARIAGVMAAKQTSNLIPLCHNIEIERVSIDFEIESNSIIIKSKAICTGKTGIEMEALTAVSVAALTIWDMCKAVDKTMKISDVTLLEKTKS